MTTNSFEERKKALEESFFARQNQELLQKMHHEQHDAETKKVLTALSGLTDETVLDELVAVGLTAASWTALSIYPLVAVAWADNKMAHEEQTAILKAAHNKGIAEGSEGHKLLEGWLVSQPGADLFVAWKDYVAALKETLEPAQYAAIKDSILQQCTTVAASAGGILGVGAISSEEKSVIASLEDAFS